MVSGLEVRYGRVGAVQGASLEVGQGEIVALLGANGAGKTSLLAAIAGVAPLSAGEIRYAGTDLRGMSPEDRARRGLSLVPEGRHLFPALTVKENLMLGAVSRRDDDVARDYEAVLVRFPEVASLTSQRAGNLSGGQQQQVALGRALMNRPRLLMLDEPSLGLAPLLVGRVFDSLDELRAAGVTVLLVEQYAERAVRLADRAYVMRRGRIVLEAASATLADSGALEAAYLGDRTKGSGDA
jgi:branched-chain amino acid transport system ATP-binding protein